MNNWERLGFQNKEEGVLHVLHFLKKHEKSICSHSLGGSATIIYGDITLILGDSNDEKGWSKQQKKD